MIINMLTLSPDKAGRIVGYVFVGLIIGLIVFKIISILYKKKKVLN